jgi:hypothetical protein
MLNLRFTQKPLKFQTRSYAAKLLAELQAENKLQLLMKIYEEEKRQVVKKELKKSIKKLQLPKIE